VFNPFPYYRVSLVNFTTLTPYVKIYNNEGNLMKQGQADEMVFYEITKWKEDEVLDPPKY